MPRWIHNRIKEHKAALPLLCLNLFPIKDRKILSRVGIFAGR
jgi:hypothetical protein